MVRYAQEKLKNFNLEGKQMIAAFKRPDFPVNKKSVNAAFGSVMIVRKLLLIIEQAKR